MRRSCSQVTLLVTTSHYTSSIPVAPPSLQARLLLFLSQHFHDIETLLSWSSWFKNRGLRQQNFFYGYTQQNYGDNVAAAYYILSLKGGFRFARQSEWFRSDRRGKFSWDFKNCQDSAIEEMDVSNTLINYTGLENVGHSHE
uniref:distal membrane-arm assembly complex protein 2-like n=1 Tax=Oncorhynchus gorbuscha TaxID=8017 RepID=UPI001EAEDEAC|nr:distal membrane-arm assembly complex protein 2-like [Oncorhynchus gorbuscha]